MLSTSIRGRHQSIVVIGIRAMYYAVCCTLCLAVTGFWGPLPVDEAEGM